MTTRQAPRRGTASSRLCAAALLVLGAWVHPALSATGSDASCDQPLVGPPMSIEDNRRLPLEVIDHGPNVTAAAGDVSLEDTLNEPGTEMAPGPAGPRVDIILRRIFDEARARQPDLSEPEQPGDLSAPLAVDKSENLEESSAGLETDTIDSGAELPGFTADELHRYRQQMYRTDI